MIVVAELKKPCSTKDRADFIVTYNHQKGYQIAEDSVSIKAMDLDPEEKSAQADKQTLDQETMELETTLNELKSMFTQAQMIGDYETMEEISATAKELLGITEEVDDGSEE